MMTIEITEDSAWMDLVPWRDYSAQELAEAGPFREFLWARSRERWIVRNGPRIAALAGVVHQDLIGQPVVWFLLANEVHISDLREARAAVRAVMHDRFPGSVTGIDESVSTNVKFARFLGLRPTGGSIAVGERKYTYYGVA